MRFRVENFRSIRSQEIELAPLTVLYGPNAAGKSSLLYALGCLKNVVLNPAQQITSFFNLGSLNLGDFEAVIFDHRRDDAVTLRVELTEEAEGLSYTAKIWRDRGHLELHAGKPYDFAMSLDPSFPYPANQNVSHTYQSPEGWNLSVAWNGFVAQVQPLVAEAGDAALSLNERLNKCTEFVRRVDLVPLVRGFFKPHYSAVSLVPILVNEDQVATYLANEKYLRNKVSIYLERIVDRELHFSSKPGVALFSFECIDKYSETSAELVNEGFGVNQLAYLLAFALRPESQTVCVEEPELHLHPSAVRRLAAVLVALATEEKKRFVVSTHSEAMIWALLALVKQGELPAEELACYFVRKVRRETIFERQKVSPAGQIEGGLRSFVESELEDLKVFLGADTELKEGEDARPAVRGK